MIRIPLPELAPLPASPPLPRVVRVRRRGAVLHPTPLTGSAEVPGLNVARGCAHRCIFCSVRAAPGYPGDGEVRLFENTVERLEEELRSGTRPRAVYISPATDPFPPIPEFQLEVARVVGVLAEHGVEAWLMTRGRIQPPVLRLLRRHPSRVKVTVPLTTLDGGLQDQLEPLTAAPAARLAQIAELKAQGFGVRVAADPLIPGLTDSRENLIGVLEALADVGVRQLTAGYLFLREAILTGLRQGLGERAEAVIRAFDGGPVLAAPGLAAARFLPRGRRRRGYATLMALAADYGISVSISGATNPDFSPPRPASPGVRLSLIDPG